jgi:hypothetical protein
MRLVPTSVRLILAVALAAVVAPRAIRAQEHGITVYENTNFTGRNMTIDHDVPNLRDFGFDRQVSSFRFPPGEVWEVCTGRDFTGRCRVFTESVVDLRRSDWNDAIMSIRRAHVDHPVLGMVPPGSLELYAGTDFSGHRIVLTRAAPDFRAFNFNDRAMSLRTKSGEAWEVCYNINFDDCRVVDGEMPNLARFELLGISSARPRGHDWALRPARTIELYSGRDFSGEVRILNGANGNLESEHFNDRTESLRVPRGQAWEVCIDAGFNNCRVIDHDVPNLALEGLYRNISSVRPHR